MRLEVETGRYFLKHFPPLTASLADLCLISQNVCRYCFYTFKSHLRVPAFVISDNMYNIYIQYIITFIYQVSQIYRTFAYMCIPHKILRWQSYHTFIEIPNVINSDAIKFFEKRFPIETRKVISKVAVERNKFMKIKDFFLYKMWQKF